MKSKKIISVLLSLVTILSVTPISVFAQSSIGSTSENPTIGEDVAQSAKTEYTEVKESTSQTSVYLTVEDSDLIVSVPTTIILSGTPDANGDYVGNYSVGVDGDLSGNKIVTIKPESEYIALLQNGKKNRDAIISQEKIYFSTSDFANKEIANGKVLSTGLTAGSWNGIATFVIYQEDVNKTIDYTTAMADMFNEKNIYNNQLLIKGYTGTSENLYIPSTMEYEGKEYSVTLRDDVFKDNKTIKNVLLAENISLFGSNSRMFQGAINLETALIENDGTFANPEIKTLNVADFNNCINLKKTYNTEQYVNATIYTANNVSVLPSIPSNVEEVTISSDRIASIDCKIPSSVTNLSITSSSVTGDIVILSEHITDFYLHSKNTNPYINSQTINIKCPNNSDTMNTIMKFIASGRHTVTAESIDGSEIRYNKIYALGDSLTAGGYYTTELNNLVGNNTLIYNYGVESDLAFNVMSRIGANNIFVKEAFTIPATKTKTKIVLNNDYCNTKEKTNQDTAGINCVTINGVLGFITYENGNYYFERVNTGKATHVCANTHITTEFEASYTKGDKLIIYIGTNDFSIGMSNDVQKVNALVDKIKAIINHCECNEYVVVGLTFRHKDASRSCSSETMAVYDEKMNEAFGNNYLNLRQYFIDNAYAICSDLTIDEEEQKDLDNGIVPAEFFVDGIHYDKTTGGKIVANAIDDKLNELNYLN